MIEYKFVKRLDVGLAVLYSDKYDYQIWVECTIRKHKRCYCTDVDLHKKRGYRPICNSANRMERISVNHINHLEELSKHETI